MRACVRVCVCFSRGKFIQCTTARSFFIINIQCLDELSPPARAHTYEECVCLCVCGVCVCVCVYSCVCCIFLMRACTVAFVVEDTSVTKLKVRRSREE